MSRTDVSIRTPDGPGPCPAMIMFMDAPSIRPTLFEIFEGARHGYTMKDLSVYDEAAAERHWRETFALFDIALKTA